MEQQINKTMNEQQDNSTQILTTSIVKSKPRYIPFRYNHNNNPQNKRIFVDSYGEAHWNPQCWEPKCELMDCGNNYIMKFELPGVDKSTISLQYCNNWLVVKGNKSFKEIDSEINDLCYTEICYGDFKREVPVPEDVNKEGISAKYLEGVLYIQLEKTKTKSWISVDIE